MSSSKQERKIVLACYSALLRVVTYALSVFCRSSHEELLLAALREGCFGSFLVEEGASKEGDPVVVRVAAVLVESEDERKCPLAFD